MHINPSGYSLEELYEMEREIDDRLTQLRLEEPAAKRKYERDHQVWFAKCQHFLSALKEVRDAIVAKKGCGDAS